MDNNININKKSLESSLYSFNLIKDNITDSYNFIDDNELERNINNDNNLEQLTFQKQLQEYDKIKNNEYEAKHFEFSGESYSGNLEKNENNNNKKDIQNNNDNNNIKDKNQEIRVLTEYEIARNCKIKSNLHYALFRNNQENSCYINVTMHFLYHCIIISDYLISLYKNYINNAENEKQILVHDKNDKELQKKIDKMKKRELMANIGEILYKYKEAINSKNRVSIIPTFEFRKKLGEISNNKFPFNYVADPVEFLDYIFEILIEINEEIVKNNFCLDIKEKIHCNTCNKNEEIKYDKNTFFFRIYVEEVFNYLYEHKKSVDKYSNKLFFHAQLSYINSSEKCSKKHNVEREFICNNNPNYLIINCIWTNRPNIDKVFKLFTLISLKNKLNDLFQVPPQKKKNMKDLNYDLTHIILYSSSLFHYITIVYNPLIKMFNIYDDSCVLECNTLLKAIEIITCNLLFQNPNYFFYPVLLIYTKSEIYNDKNIININQIDPKAYFDLKNKCDKIIDKYQKELNKKEKDKLTLGKNNQTNNNINNIKKEEMINNNEKDKKQKANDLNKKITTNKENDQNKKATKVESNKSEEKNSDSKINNGQSENKIKDNNTEIKKNQKKKNNNPGKNIINDKEINKNTILNNKTEIEKIKEIKKESKTEMKNEINFNSKNETKSKELNNKIMETKKDDNDNNNLLTNKINNNIEPKENNLNEDKDKGKKDEIPIVDKDFKYVEIKIKKKKLEQSENNSNQKQDNKQKDETNVNPKINN